MHILLCDDNRLELKDLEGLVRCHLDSKAGLSYTLSVYDNSARLDFDLEDLGKADLYILDIDMPGINGIQLAVRIRELHPLAMIYFYTSHSEYATEGYRVEARRYLLKGGNPAYLYEALDYAIAEIEKQQKECVTLSYYHDTINVPVSDIMYVTREHRLLSVYTHNAPVIYATGSIQDLFQKIGRPGFVFLDRSTILNIDYVRSTEQNTVNLFNGQTLYISRKRIPDVKQAINLYWRAR